MMRRKMRKSQRENLLSETKSWRGELCYYEKLVPHHCSRPNCSPMGEKPASRGPKGDKNIARNHKLTRCITKSNF